MAIMSRGHHTTQLLEKVALSRFIVLLPVALNLLDHGHTAYGMAASWRALPSTPM